MHPGDTHMQKQALNAKIMRGVGRGIKEFLHNDVWGSIGRRTANSTSLPGRAANWTARRFFDPATNQATGLGGALGMYGMAGMFTDRLPGSTLAMNLTMPGHGALMDALPSAITFCRASTAQNKARLLGDVREGGSSAASQFISAVQDNPRVAYQPGAYDDFMHRSGADTAQIDRYRKGQPGHMGLWDTASSYYSDPQRIIDSHTDDAIINARKSNPYMSKGAGWAGTAGKMIMPMAKKLWGGAKTGGRAIGKALPYATPLFAGGAIGHAVFSDKPYDEEAARAKGMAAGQAGIQDALSGMSGIERFAANMDPSLAVGKLEEHMPGSISRWEQETGRQYQPGFISQAIKSWDSGGKGKYYTYDMNNNRQYIG